MAESILFGIAENLLGKLGSRAVQEIGFASGVTGELNKLKATLETIQAVRLDAEKLYDHSSEVSVYFARLKDACYDADDVLDEFEIAALQKQVLGQQGSIKKKVCHFFSSSNPIAFRFKMGHKIKEIRERLDAVAADKNKFHLPQIVDNRIIPVWRETHSLINPSDVIGRDKDKKKIVNVLIHSDQNQHLSVIAIVGIGGLGKTALAKYVYNDERVIQHFEVRKWVCVSSVFDQKMIIEKIVNRKDLNMQELLEPLQQTFGKKRYLLIMDDVWNEDINKWREVRDLLMCGAYGSKVVVTTRNTSVTSIMGAIYPLNLKGLSHEDSLSLLMKVALEEGPMEKYQNLEEIGRVIVSKCKGVPLAIKTLGNLLYRKTEERDWRLVIDSEIWKLEQTESGILPVLKLSYNQLPSYLKQCFAVCSLFPKGFDFISVYLTHVWMALGLLGSSDKNLEWEDIGQMYFTQLWSRSFFQDVDDIFLICAFKIHDLMHDLALSMTRYEHATLSKDSLIVVGQKVRHISFGDDDLLRNELPSSILQLKNLRTIFRLNYNDPHCGYPFVKLCISRFKRLRVLDLCFSSFETLPSSISGLKHLRFLDLQNNKSIKSLPNSICKLQSLQFLRLLNCTELQKLPRDFGNLISLRYLDLTTQERRLPSKGFESLISLRFLRIVECHNLEYMFANDSGIKIHHGLSNLRTLWIHHCKSLVYLPQYLRYLTALQNLWFNSCGKLELDLMMEREEEDTIYGGGGLASLRVLVFINLPKLVALPRWILQVATTTLIRIVISNCCNFNTFPDDLKYLQVIWIGNCPKLKSLPEGMSCFSKLREILIEDCDELVRRCQRETGEDWHKISHVHDIYLNRIKI